MANLHSMKRIIFTFLTAIVLSLANAQQSFIDSLQQQIDSTKSDTAKLVLTRLISRVYSEINSDSCYVYATKSLELAKKLKLKLVEASALREIGYAQMNMGNYPRSLQTILSGLAIAQDPKSEAGALTGHYPGDDALSNHAASPHAQRLAELGFTQQILGILYGNANNNEKAMFHHREAIKWATESGNVPLQSVVNMTMARTYLNLKKPDSALLTEQKAYDQVIQSGYQRYLGSVLLNMGRIYAVMGSPRVAAEYYKKALEASAYRNYYPRGVVASNLLLAEYYHENAKRDSSLEYIRNALAVAEEMNTPELLQRCYTAMAKHYNTIKNNDSTVKYQALIIQTNGKLFDSKQAQQFKNIDFDEQQRQAQIEAAQKDYRQKMGTYALLAGLALFLFIAFILWRSSRQRKLANIQLSRQKRELEAALETLKTTQSQLIQSEKMASLGELTAGIAHEIQNPLNFVNNFSEVNQELLEELRNEKAKPKSERNEQLEDDLLTSIEQNLEKINHHGKRADAIVKGMLQHSRASSPQKEPIDVNALVDEYLRLAYHGLRAKDKSFNTKFETDFDPLLQKIIAVPQEIGRVVLNLINNAFYSVSEKSKLLQEGSFAVAQGYEPKIYVSTKKMNGNAEIRVRDNGMGIPAEIADKIFQPFFTTKPAGQGTGLGLSLAYDIITKGHGGELKVTTEEGEGTEFVIVLPITSEQ